MKNIVLVLFLLAGLMSYSQKIEVVKDKKSVGVEKVIIKVNSVKKLQNFDWDGVKKLFKDTPNDKEVSISVFYKNLGDVVSPSSKEYSTMTLQAKKKNLDKVIDPIKSFFENYDEKEKKEE